MVEENQLNENQVTDLFVHVLEHLRCIEIRIQAAKGITTKNQKHALGKALKNAQLAIDNVCGILPDTKSVVNVKNYLERADLVYLMLITEQVFRVPPEDVEIIVELIENHINTKYRNTDVKDGNS
jgi:hypothetical protein